MPTGIHLKCGAMGNYLGFRTKRDDMANMCGMSAHSRKVRQLATGIDVF
jgi:hypothetical protein